MGMFQVTPPASSATEPASSREEPSSAWPRPDDRSPGSSQREREEGARERPTIEARRWIGLGIVGLIAVTTFWAFDALPFQDLPAHAGLIAMRHRWATSVFEQRYYVLAPHIGPYSLFRFLGEMLIRLVGPLSAVRVLATLPVVATPLALLFARRRLYADTSPTYGFIGISLSFGIMTLLGFASYLLGVAVMLVALTLWLDLLVHADEANDAHDIGARRAARKREIIVACFAPLMFIAHGHAFLLFVVCAFITAIVTGRRKARLLRVRALVPALLLAGWVAWIEGQGTTPPGSVPRTVALVPHFQGPGEKLGLLLSGTLMTRTGIDFLVGFVILTFTVACTVIMVRSLTRARTADPLALEDADTRHSRAFFACAAAILVVFFALPHAIGWFGFVDGRLVPVTLMLALLGVRRTALPQSLGLGLHYGAPVAAAALALLAMVASYRFQDEARGYKEVLAHVPAESRLLNLPLDPNSDVFTAHPFVHYDKLVLADRPIVVSDVWFHQGSALYPTPQNPTLRLPSSYSESNLKVIDWPAYHLEDWDYVLIRTRPSARQPRLPAHESLALEAHQGGWWLFRHARGSEERSRSAEGARERNDRP
jgi:hypothetical protein